MTNKLNRRQFIATTSVALGAGGTLRSQDGGIPRRVLGKTGERVSILGFGGGSRFLMYEDEEEALGILNRVIDSGLNYLDTANNYGNGKSEERYGKVLKHRRKDVFVATKISVRGYDEALQSMEAALRRLQTDRLDLVHVHGLDKMDDLAAVEKGVLKALYRLRDEGVTRFIGMTSHSDAATLKTAIERHDLDCVQMALNAATRTGHATGFEEIALPAAREKNLGILAMKISGQDRLVGAEAGRASMRDLLFYSMSLPVAVCVVGMPKPEFVRENLELARNFQPLPEADKERIRGQVHPSVAALDDFMRLHRDA